MIPFSPPRVDDKICDEVVAVLKSGWITTGHKTKLFEKKISEYCGIQNTLCLNSATAGLEIMLRWFGVGPGDEVILPAYTYSATANVIVHCGATPVFVDVCANDFNINHLEIEKVISSKTKVIMPVDFAGFPCDYEEINSLAKKYSSIFIANCENQKMLGRILILSDSAHSFGASYNKSKAGSLTDVSVFSFHAVKNLTTAEGGAVALNLPLPFNNADIYSKLCISTLHGQNKDALAKTQKGNWKYDIVEAGYKCNMTDISAAIGLVELERYDNDTLIKRKSIVYNYQKAFEMDDRFELPLIETKNKTSCYHLYPLRIKGITEQQRDLIIQEIFNADVSVNVHFIPVPATSFYKSLGYDLLNYPVTYNNFSREISLPVFYDLSPEQQNTVINAVKNAVNTIL
jgi:dTDP-4-amino-4,6-dideoxygalactose transaminase